MSSEQWLCVAKPGAYSEQCETQHWIDTAADCRYLTSKQASTLNAQCQEIGRLLGGMMKKSAVFCQNLDRTLRESELEYFVVIEDSEQYTVSSNQ